CANYDYVLFYFDYW
nr:immunoglobulin heavy chain junction region [Mus musculus]